MLFLRINFYSIRKVDEGGVCVWDEIDKIYWRRI